MTPSSNVCSVHRMTRWCRNRMQNDDLPEPIGPLTKHEKGCFNLRTSHMERWVVTRCSPRDRTTIYIRKGWIVLHSPPLEGNSITFDLGFRHYRFLLRSYFLPLTFDLTLRINIDDVFGIYKIIALITWKLNKILWRGNLVMPLTLHSFLAFISDYPVQVIYGPH